MRFIQKAGLVGLGLFAGVAISLNYPAMADKETVSTPLPVEELRAFSEVFGRIKSDYVEPVTDKALITNAISGMLNGLDPHSAYLDADAFKELQVGTHGEFGGLGLEVGMEDGVVKVISPIEDTPAYQAGIKPGDFIIKIDRTLIKGMALNDAVKRMRGKPGSKVVLTIIRKNEPKPFEITLTRAVIKVRSVKFKLIEPGYGFVRITQFQEMTGQNLATALEKLVTENKGPLKGLVLDLRNDPGGLLTAAVAVSSAFLPKNALVVYTEGRTEDAQMRLTANPDNYLRSNTDKDYLKNVPDSIKGVPLIVLVNAGTASASEIVAGALQDHKRAVIMGEQTFGKGSVQTVLPLGNGTGIKLTTARYYTPGGRSIQAKGIQPDILVEDPASAGRDSSIFRLREADLNKHLVNDRPSRQKPENSEQKTLSLPDSNEEAPNLAPAEFGSKNDYQLNQALNLLKGMQILLGK
ncbi:MAG: S41 family peptidase [Gallionella sp.]